MADTLRAGSGVFFEALSPSIFPLFNLRRNIKTLRDKPIHMFKVTKLGISYGVLLL